MKKLSLIRSSVRLSSIPRFANLALAFWLAFAMVATQAGEDNGKGQSLQTYPQPLIAWSFADAEGTFVPDVTGHGYDATIYGQPQFVHRWDQVALAFDGSGDNSFWHGGVQNCGLGIDKRLTQAFNELSIAAWVRKQPAWWMPIVYRDLWDNPAGFGLYMEWTSGKAVFGHYDAIGHRSQVQSVTVVQDGHWHYVVGTMQPSTSDPGYLYRIYVDGQLDAQQVGLWAVDEASAVGGILKIAYPNITGADLPLKGSIEGVAIFDVALTGSQVKALFDATRQRP
jgi:hypothetical protein